MPSGCSSRSFATLAGILATFHTGIGMQSHHIHTLSCTLLTSFPRGMDAQDPENAEIFNGDAYSMGSNGKYVQRDTGPVFSVPLPASFLQSLPNPQQNVSLPVNSGTGGGCINADGPFGGNDVAHIGPTLVGFYGTTPTQFGPNLFKYNPRCIVSSCHTLPIDYLRDGCSLLVLDT